MKLNLSKRAVCWGIAILALLILPLLELYLPREYRVADLLRPIFIFAVLGLGLNIVTGYTGLLNLGSAAFMAIGAYTFAILSCDIYPFQLGFWLSLCGSLVAGSFAGLLIGLPTLRMSGDYLAIVTMGFGEIVQDVLRNLEGITKGTQGINPLPAPVVLTYSFDTENFFPWYYLFLAILLIVVMLNRNLENSRLGRAWVGIREDELAASCMGIDTVRVKLLSFSSAAALCGLAGGLWASYLGSSGEPGNYDFTVSVIALCIVIVGGMGNIAGVLLGALVMIGFNSVLLVRISDFLSSQGLTSTSNVFSSPNNWKYMIFGLALVLMMRFRPEGLLPSSRMQAELQSATLNQEEGNSDA